LAAVFVPVASTRASVPRTDVWPFPAMLIPAGTTAAADSCPVHRSLSATTVGSLRHPDRPPRIRTTAVAPSPPRLPHPRLGGLGRHRAMPAHPRGQASYAVRVPRVGALPRASFRPHLAVTPLPPAGVRTTSIPRGLAPPSCCPCRAYIEKPASLEAGFGLVRWSRHSDLNRGPAVYEPDRPKRCGLSVGSRAYAAQLAGLRFELVCPASCCLRGRG